MDKSLLIKLAVVGIILAFVIQTFAFGMLNNPNSGIGGGGNAISNVAFQGTVVVPATVTSYKPVIILQGTRGQVAEAVKPLVASGAVIYTGEPDEENMTLVNLAGDADVRAVAKSLEGGNVTVYTTAVISLPSRFNITTPEGQREIEGTTFDLGTPEILGENETLQMSVYLYVQNGKIVQLQNPVFMQEKKALLLEGTVSGGVGASYAVLIPFEQRRIDKEKAKAIFSAENYSIEIKEISYIAFDPPLSQEQLSKLNFPYVTYSQPASVSISPTFTDGAKLRSDFELAGVNATPPYSFIRVAGNANEDLENESAKIAGLGKLVANESSLQIAYRAELSLPDYMELDGKRITGFPQKVNAIVDSKPNIGDKISVTITAWVSGSRIVKIETIGTG
jgi:hypothetical protein